MKVLVIDDEAPARRRLIRQLEQLAGVEVVGEAADGEAALASVAALAPDLLLLDIQMPGLDGLALVRRHGELPPVVFVTAFDSHAVEAFELNAVDYLLKPVRTERLAAAIQRARARQLATPVAVSRVLDALAPATTRVVSVTRGTSRIFEACAVTRFWSADKYTLFRAEGDEHMTEEPLLALEQRLAAHGFLRVHRGELVNLREVRAVRSEDGALVLELGDGQLSRVSRRSAASVRAALGV